MTTTVETTARIALTNLGKYNEGALVFTWLELPATEDEIEEAMNEIGVAPNTQYEEWFISDYEAPFDISEYMDLDRLNEVVEELDDLPQPKVSRFGSLTLKQYNVADVIAFATNHGKEDFVEHIVSDETVNEMVRGMVENGDDWTRIRCFTNDASGNAEWHAIDGYANLEVLTDEDIESIINDITNEIISDI